jgi:tRNA U34 5-carboxymethylaminomethyl modifying GTPase MnmE/TrmE
MPQAMAAYAFGARANAGVATLGQLRSDDLLGEIFGSFCIGK